jgi:hypothetical protein
MAGPATYANDLSAVDADLDAAADRTDSARGRHPPPNLDLVLL